MTGLHDGLMQAKGLAIAHPLPVPALHVYDRRRCRRKKLRALGAVSRHQVDNTDDWLRAHGSARSSQAPVAPAVIRAMDSLAAHLVTGLDWLVELGIGVIVAAAGVLLFRQARSGGLAFALALFIAETGALVALRALIAAGHSSRWQYIMPFALVLVPAIYVVFILSRLQRWRAAGFTHPRDWRRDDVRVPRGAPL